MAHSSVNIASCAHEALHAKLNGVRTRIYNVKRDWAIFPGQSYHEPMPCKGTRVSLIYFTANVHLLNKAGLTPEKLHSYMVQGWPVDALPANEINYQWASVDADYMMSIAGHSDADDTDNIDDSASSPH